MNGLAWMGFWMGFWIGLFAYCSVVEYCKRVYPEERKYKWVEVKRVKNGK